MALCGNSGRSPEPHLHFQVQTTPLLGTRTIDYPFAYYHERKGQSLLRQFSKPEEGDFVTVTNTIPLIKKAFEITPASILRYVYKNGEETEKTEQWEAFTDAYNNKYLYCKETESSAFYINDGSMFYFTSFDGDKNSLLYYFYLTAYKVFFGSINSDIKDAMPLNILRNKRPGIWFQDFLAPFYSYMRIWFSIQPETADSPFDTEILVLKSKIQVSMFKNIRTESSGIITLSENCIKEFTYENEKTKIHAKCLKV